MAHRIYEAAVDQRGQVRLMETMACSRPTRALVIVLEGEQPSSEFNQDNTLSNDGARVQAATSTTASWRNKYRPIRPLGQGGMGQVLLAERLSDGASVCVKFFREGVNRAVLQQECRALLRLRHPSVVGLLDFSVEETPHWLVLEYATGSTLRLCLNERGSFPPLTVVNILKPVLEGLAYAHSQQVIHRDLKPENIMVDDHLQIPFARTHTVLSVRILDFGLAIVDRWDHLGNFTAMNAIPAGTFRYMAPEQLRSELLSPACDIYAVGLMGWEMLVGRLPFETLNGPKLLMEKIGTSTGYQLSDFSVPAPVPLRNLIEACTRPNPDSRPTASEALTTLNDLAL